MNGPDRRASVGSHLAEHELVDALEGTLDATRRQHIADCEVCRRQVDDLRVIADAAATVEVPDPPAFFWAQFSARVRAAVAEETGPWWRSAWLPRWAPPAIASVIAAAVVLIGVLPAVNRSSSPREGGESLPVAPNTAVVAAGDPTQDVFTGIDDDEAWAVVRALAEDLDHDEMGEEGVAAELGAAEHLALGLTDSERFELARLLEEQLKGRRRESVS